MCHADLIIFIFSFSILLLVAIFSGRLAHKFGMPKIIGELIGGIVFGPTIMGTFFPEAQNWLFSYSSPIIVSRDVLLKFGAILLLFIVGLEVNLSKVKELKKTILWTSLFGSAFPFVLGASSVFLFPKIWDYVPSENGLLLPLFIGTALSISALPVIARILMDMGMLKSKVGSIILATATIDDIVGWILFAVLTAYFVPSGAGHMNPLITVGVVLAMFFFAITYGNRLTGKLVAWCEKRTDGDNLFLGVTVALVLASSALAERSGIHAVLGAFLVGLAFSNCEPHKMHDSLRKVVMSVFSPLYFVSVGLGVNLAKNFDLSLVLIVIAIATIGKVGGVWLGARISKLNSRESLAVGFGMNARGAVGVILVTSAYQAKIIDERVFVALLVMAIVTSLISGPMMKKALAAKS
ncbi:MAG: cation:proton antiporter [Candidatus Moranbacteria bacterium]|nr:cation:proton antiporter [Candidatus Moranbacteria bacterium]